MYITTEYRSFCIRQGRFLIQLITGAIYVLIVFVMQIILIISGIYLDTLHTLFFLFFHTVTAYQNEGYASSVIRVIYEFLFISLSIYIFSSLFIYLPNNPYCVNLLWTNPKYPILHSIYQFPFCSDILFLEFLEKS